MVFFILLGIGLWYVSSVSASQAKTSVVFCGSLSCAHNRRGRCGRREIVVYDNTVIGLCLYHMETMAKRILEPIRENRKLKHARPNLWMAAKITRKQEKTMDSELIKNPKAFVEWMRKCGGTP
jgi:hypothetical protein